MLLEGTLLPVGGNVNWYSYFPGGAEVKNLPANAGDARDMSSIPGSGRSLGEENGNLLQYSCLKTSIDRGVWQAIVHGVSKSWTPLSMYSHTLWRTVWSFLQKLKVELTDDSGITLLGIYPEKTIL